MPAIFFFNDTATTEIYTLSLHDALPICEFRVLRGSPGRHQGIRHRGIRPDRVEPRVLHLDRKSTRLNSSHSQISYAVFCLKKTHTQHPPATQPALALDPGLNCGPRYRIL